MPKYATYDWNYYIWRNFRGKKKKQKKTARARRALIRVITTGAPDALQKPGGKHGKCSDYERRV